MRSTLRWLLAVAALATVAAAPASAQPYGDRDDGPPPFRRGFGFDGPPRGPWDRWHRHRRWRDEGFDRRDFRDGDRRGGRDRFGGERDRFGGERDRFGGNRERRDEGGRGRDDARRDGGDEGSRRGGPNRDRRFGDDE